MRVGLVARFLGLPTGLGTYSANLLLALDRLEDDNEYVIYTPRWSDPPTLGSRFTIRRSSVPRSSRAALTAWDLTVPALGAVRDRPDVLHYLHAASPLLPARGPMLVNLLDAIHWVVPGYRLPQPYDWLERRAVKGADLVVTLSESAKSDIEEVLDIPADRLRVTPLGGPPVDPQPHPKEPYFLFVGGTEKRKNLALALEAFAGVEGFELWVVGKQTSSQVHDAMSERPGVRWLGFVSEAELIELYRHATALVFPSRYEGFGLPLLEAMARHTPVIAADTSSIPEVTRGAAILVDANDVEGLRTAMRRVGGDPSLRAELTQRGLEVLSGFSWAHTARTTVAAYEELAAVR